MNREEQRALVWDKNMTTLNGVEFILENFPKTRDDERLLIEQYYKTFYGLEVPEWILYGGKGYGRKENFIPQMHSIRRMARKVQNTFGKFPPSEEQKKTRQEISTFHKSFHI